MDEGDPGVRSSDVRSAGCGADLAIVERAWGSRCQEPDKEGRAMTERHGPEERFEQRTDTPGVASLSRREWLQRASGLAAGAGLGGLVGGGATRAWAQG